MLFENNSSFASNDIVFVVNEVPLSIHLSISLVNLNARLSFNPILLLYYDLSLHVLVKITYHVLNVVSPP